MHRGCFLGILIVELVVLLGASASAQKITSALQEKAKSGDIGAMLKLARACEAGLGAQVDLAQAAFWYEHAANAGDSWAQTKLATLYLQGVGVPKDSVEGVRWLRRAASSGFPLAQFNLGMVYLHGEGVTRSDAEGIHWLREAADKGIPERFHFVVVGVFNGLANRSIGVTAVHDPMPIGIVEMNIKEPNATLALSLLGRSHQEENASVLQRHILWRFTKGLEDRLRHGTTKPAAISAVRHTWVNAHEIV